MVAWGRGRGQADTWPTDDAARGRGGFVWPSQGVDAARAFAARIRAWAVADSGSGRLLPWLPVAFGFGIAIYFTAESEPKWWAGCGLTALLVIASGAARRRPVAFPVLLALSAVAAGFSTATIKTAQIAHPILHAGAAANVAITGFVEVREAQERTDRIVVRAVTMEGARDGQKLKRVRVSVRKGTAPPVGSFVNFRARLNAPLEPLRPGGYDFARDLYFQNIGAVGFVLGAIKTMPAVAAPDWRLRYTTMIYDLRAVIDTRIRLALAGDRGAIASALITGTRDAITAPVNDAMYISSLAHVLSISGYHMAVVAGVVFFVLRAGLALVPALAIRRPIKKWIGGIEKAGEIRLLLPDCYRSRFMAFRMAPSIAAAASPCIDGRTWE